MYITIANNASFAPSRLNIVLMIIPQGLQLRIWFKRHVKAGKLPEKMRLVPQFSVQTELRSTNTLWFLTVHCPGNDWNYRMDRLKGRSFRPFPLSTALDYNNILINYWWLNIQQFLDDSFEKVLKQIFIEPLLWHHCS